MAKSLSQQLSDAVGKPVIITGNKIKFEGKDGKVLAKFRLAGLPSCCGASVLYGFRLYGRSKDGKVEKLVCKVIERHVGRSWSYVETTTQNLNKIKAFRAAGWELKGIFQGRNGETYQFQKKVRRNSTGDDW